MEKLKKRYKALVDSLLQETITSDNEARIAYRRLMQIEYVCKGLGWDVVEILGGDVNAHKQSHRQNQESGFIPDSR